MLFRTTTKSLSLVPLNSSDRDLPRKLSSNAYVHAKAAPYTLVSVVLRSETFFLFCHPSWSTLQSPLYLYSSPSSLALPLSSNTRFLRTVFNLFFTHPFANSSTQTFRPPLTHGLAPRESVVLFLRQKRKVLTTSLNDYTIALHHTDWRVLEQGLRISTVVTAARYPCATFHSLRRKKVS